MNSKIRKSLFIAPISIVNRIMVDLVNALLGYMGLCSFLIFEIISHCNPSKSSGSGLSPIFENI